MKKLRDIVGTRVRELRRQHGLSQQALADTFDTSEKTIVSIEKGYHATNLDILEQLALQLGVKPEDLLKDTPLELKMGSLAHAPPPGINTGLSAYKQPQPPAEPLSPTRQELLSIISKIREDSKLRTLLLVAKGLFNELQALDEALAGIQESKSLKKDKNRRKA